MLSSSCISIALDLTCPASQGLADLDVETDGSSTLVSSWSTDGDTNIGKISASICRKQVLETLMNDESVGTDQPSPDTMYPKNTPELATKILKRFGLEKEDMENLLSYPEDQVTVGNLPVILQQICILKEKKTARGLDFPPISSTTGPDGRSCSEGPQVDRVKALGVKAMEDKKSGLEGKLPGVLEEASRGNESKNRLSIGREDSYSSLCEELQWKSTTQVGTGDQKSSSIGLGSFRTSVDPPPRNSNKCPTQPNKELQTIFSLFPLLKQGSYRSSGKSEVCVSPLTKEPNSVPQIQPSASLLRDADSGQADSMDFNGNMCNKNGETHGRLLTGVETKANQKHMKQKSKQRSQEELKRLVPKIQISEGFSALSPGPPPSMRPRMVSVSPCLPQTASNPVVSTPWLQPPPGWRFLPEVSVFNGLPPRAMMDDYAAATPRAFPHTCSLCSKVCTDIKDWIFHQNIRSHLENCKLLRMRYPSWDCTVPLMESFLDKNVRQYPSTSAQTFQRYNRRIGAGNRSRSRSNSPYSHSRLDHRWDGSRSSSRSPVPRSDGARKAGSKPRKLASSPHRHRQSHKRPSSSRRKKRGRSSSHRRRSSTTVVPSNKRLRSSRVEKLTKRLLKTPAVQALMTKPKLKAVIKTAVPVILAELGKLKSSSSSSLYATKRSSGEVSNVKPGNMLSREHFPPKPKRKRGRQPISVGVGVFKRQPTESSSSKKEVPPPTRKPSSSSKLSRVTSKRVSRAKVLVSKAKHLLNQQVVRSLKTRAAKFIKGKKGASKLQGATNLKLVTKRVNAGESKPKTRPEINQRETEESLKALEEIRRELETQIGRLKEEGEVSHKPVEEEATKSLHTVSDYNLDAAATRGAKSALVADDGAETLKTTPEPKQQAELDEGNHHTEFKEAETQKLVETRAADGEEIKTTTAVKLESTSLTSPAAASGCVVSTSEPANPPRTQLKLLRTSVGSSSQGPKNEMTTSRRKAETEALKKQQNAALPNGFYPLLLVRTQPGRALSIKTRLSAAFHNLTVEQSLQKFLSKDQIDCLSKKTIMSSKLFSLNATVLFLTNLAQYFQGCYREDEVANLLHSFGFIYQGNDVYVIPHSCMETMHRALMKWSRAASRSSLNMEPSGKKLLPFRSLLPPQQVSELPFLQERLLSAEISNLMVHLVMTVVKTVASVAALVNVLPLTNRIVIEMVKPSGVTEAVPKISLDSSAVHQTWRKVKPVEPLKSLNLCLQDSSETEINLEVNLARVNATPSPVKLVGPAEIRKRVRTSSAQKPAATLESIPGVQDGTDTRNLVSGQRTSRPQQRGDKAPQSSVTAKRTCPSTEAWSSMEVPQLDRGGSEHAESISASSSESQQAPEMSEKDFLISKRRKLEQSNQARCLETGSRDQNQGMEECAKDKRGRSADDEVCNIIKSQQMHEGEKNQTSFTDKDHQEGPQVTYTCVTADRWTRTEYEAQKPEAATKPGELEDQPPAEQELETVRKWTKKSIASTSGDRQPTRTDAFLTQTPKRKAAVGKATGKLDSKTSTGPERARGSPVLSEVLQQRGQEAASATMASVESSAEPTNAGSATEDDGSHQRSQAENSETPPLKNASGGEKEARRGGAVRHVEINTPKKAEELTEMTGDERDATEEKSRLGRTNITKDAKERGAQTVDGSTRKSQNVLQYLEKVREEGGKKELRRSQAAAEGEEDASWTLESPQHENEKVDVCLCEGGEDETEEESLEGGSWWDSWEVTDENWREFIPLDETEEEQGGPEDQGRLEACFISQDSRSVDSVKQEDSGFSEESKKISVISKPSRGFDGPEAKRFRFQPPFVSIDFKLFTCRPPIGEEFVEPRLGFFCSICSVFYLNEAEAEDHCCSRAHYDNLKSYYQNLSSESSRTCVK